MILAIDTGYGENKIAYRDKDNKLKYKKLTSAIAEAPQDTEDMPMFEGQRYYIGDIALMEDSEKIKTILDYKDHERYAPLYIWQALDDLKLKPQDIDKLAIGLSLAQKDYAKNFINRVSKFTINNVKFDFKDKIVLVPQGIGAKYAIDFLYFKDLSNTETYAIIDIGQLTVDVVTVINGKVRRENAGGTAHIGVIKIIQEIQELVAEKHEMISVKEAQEILKNRKYVLYGEEYNLEDKINEYIQNYTKFLITILKQQYKNIFKKYPKIFLVGGGAYYIDKNLLQQYTNSQSIEIPQDSEFLNAIGDLLVAEQH